MPIKLFECSKCKKVRVFNVDDLKPFNDDNIKTNVENDLKNGLPYCHICDQYMKMKDAE
jgi:transcription elongation factor Elf1